MIRDAAKRLFEAIANASPLDLTLRATLAMLLFSRWVLGDDWLYFTPLLMLAGVGLVVPGFYKSRVLWYGIAACMVLKTIDHWWVQDNHLFLLTLLCLAIAIALAFESSKEVLAQNGRLLLGISFFFAVVWKCFLSPDYMSGAYFHYSILTDNRFSEEAAILANLSPETVNENVREVFEVVTQRKSVGTLKTSQAARRAGQVITWHTAIIEALLALTFLWPRPGLVRRSRNLVFLAFAWTTYLAAPVITFGWTLSILCIAQTENEERRGRFLLVMTLPLLFAYKHVPAMEALASWVVSQLWN